MDCFRVYLRTKLIYAEWSVPSDKILFPDMTFDTLSMPKHIRGY